MKRLPAHILLMVLLMPLCIVNLHGESNVFGHPFFKQRNQCLNLPRRMVGEVHHLFRSCMKDLNGSLSATPQYSQNFKRTEIGEYLFFNGTNTMRFGPENIDGTNPTTDVAASQFLLGEGFVGTINTRPKVQNFIIDFGVRIGFDNWLEDLYVDVQAPFNWTQWDLSFTETPIAAGTGTIPIGQVGNNFGAAPAPFECIREAWNGQGVVDQVNQPLTFARVNGAQDKIRLADVQVTVGYNFVNCPDKHIGLNLRIIAPTGNRPAGVYFFEPISGGGKHTYVGGGIDGHFDIYHDCCKQQFLSFYFFGTLYHMFGARQKRTFDLKNNGIGSRYLLFKRFNALGTYDNTILHGPNVLTLDANVNVSAVGEGVALFSFERKNMSVDWGYNVWGRSRERITKKEEILHKTFGIKGNTNTFFDTTPGTTRNQTASQSRIDGTNFNLFDVDNMGNPAIVFISTEDLDFAGAEHPRAVSHSLFGHVSFVWEHDKYLSGFWGVGGEVEFSGSGNTALNQWSIWTKGGIFFS